MRVGLRREIQPRRLILRLRLKQRLPCILRQIHVIINIVFKDRRDRQLARVHLRVPQRDGVAHGHTQRVGKTAADDARSVRGIGHRLSGLRVQVDQPVHTAGFRADDVRGLGLPVRAGI